MHFLFSKLGVIQLAFPANGIHWLLAAIVQVWIDREDNILSLPRVSTYKLTEEAIA